MATLIARWNQFWFATTRRYHYGLFRILFVGGFFVLPRLITAAWPERHQISRVAELAALEGAAEELAQPVLLLRLLPLPITPPSWLGPLIVVLAALATVGLATRVALVGLAASYLYAGSILNSYGFIAHDTTLPMLVLLVLAVSPGIDALSLDAFWRSRAGSRSTNQPWTGFGQRVPVWPAHLILVLLALVYFASGYAKVRESGIDWGSGETLQSYATDPQPAPYFLQDPEADRPTFRDGVGLESFLYTSGRPSWVLRTVAENDLVAGFMSMASLLWELTFPLVIVWRRLLPWYLGTGLVFHGAVTLGFGLYSFYSYPLCYLVFVDWTWVADHARVLAARVGFGRSRGTESSPA